MGIKIIKEKKAGNYTFIDNGIEQPEEQKRPKVKKGNAERDFRLRDDSKLDKLKHKSKATGGRSMQGHSPVYE